jgi:glutathione synthase/RimK-type ligase-like ATP-grasp enzyme
MRLFHGRRLHGDWGIRVEQAQFSEISLSAYSEAGVSIDICRGENRVVRSLRPDFVLLRQHTRDATDNWKNVILGLQYGGIPSINSLHSIYNFMDKPWVFAQLIQIQKRLGKEKFPLIEQCYYPNYKEMLVSSKFPIVVKIGHAHSGSGKVKVENQQSFQDIASLTAVANSYSTTELLVEAQCDIYIEKIGNSYKAFTRKSVSGNWKASSGSVVLEQIAMTERYRMWADECSLLFGGLDMLAVQAVQAKDGQEYIIDVTDSSMALLGGGAQGDDYRQVVDLVVNKMEVYCRKASIPQSSISKTTSAGALTDYTVANGPSPQQHAFEQMRNHPYTSAAPHPLAAASSPFPPPSGPPQQPPRPPPTASAPPRPVSQRPIPTGMGLQEQQQPPQPPQRPGSSTQVDI